MRSEAYRERVRGKDKFNSNQRENPKKLFRI